MSKLVVRPYYKYKKEAYNNLLKVITSILNEASVFERKTEFIGKDFNLSYDVSRNIPGDIVVSCNGCWLATLNVNTLLITGPQVYQLRDMLTQKECNEVKKNIKVLFRDGNSTVIARFDNLLHDWFVNGEECYFMSMRGICYRNREV